MVLSSVPETSTPKDVLQYPREGTLSITSGDSLQSYSGELLVVAVWSPPGDDKPKDEKAKDKKPKYKLSKAVKKLDTSLSGSISELVADAEFSAKVGSCTEICRLSSSKVQIKRVVLYGLGPSDSPTKNVSLCNAAKFAVSKASGVKACTSVGLYIEGGDAEDDNNEIVKVITEGAVSAAYVDERFKKEKKDQSETMMSKKPTELEIIGMEVNEDSVFEGNAIAMGVITAKEVVNAPANFLTPASLALAAKKVAKETGLSCKVLGRAQCEKLGMGLFLGVGRGSTDEPKFIHLTYTPDDGIVNKKICIIGKAVTFDTGGTNLKVGAGSMIELMKFDMGGSAVVLGTAKTIGEMKPQGIQIEFIMPAVENMLSDKAIHPGDILTGSNGKTVEIINTDAEGRLCLGDALVYAEKLGDVDYIVDLATLTGAVLVSLGSDVAGVWSPNEELANSLKGCGENVGEKMWHMPLVEEYAESLKSRIADLKNIGVGCSAGSITAALFLKEFVETKNWAHIDMAGTVWAEKKDGATGYGVKTMVEWVGTLSSSEE